VLQAFSEADHTLTLSEIAHALRSNTTTATRLCYTLSELGFIHKDGQRRYHLTPKILTLGILLFPDWPGRKWLNIIWRSFSRRSRRRSICLYWKVRKLFISFASERENISLSIFKQVPNFQFIARRWENPDGHGPPEKIKPILKTLEFKPLTAHTITRLDKFLNELGEVLKKGYAINDEELSIGNRALAAPIMSQHGYAVAAINIAVPTTEYSPEPNGKDLGPPSHGNGS